MQYSHQLENCGFTRWVDPAAIDPYQTYIAYLENVIDKQKHELSEALATKEDDGEPKLASPSPMVFKMNTGCQDEWWCCPCHEEKKKSPPATPSPPPSPLPPPPAEYYMPSQHSGGSMFSGQYSYQ